MYAESFFNSVPTIIFIKADDHPSHFHYFIQEKYHSMISGSYYRFIIESDKIWKGLPERERRILIEIYGQDPQNPMRVMDIILRSNLGSQATIHASLTNLQLSKHVKLTSYKNNGRTKFITLTPKSASLFKRLDQLMDALIKP